MRFKKRLFLLQPQLILFLFHQKIETHEGIQKHISGMHAEDGEWSMHAWGYIFMHYNFKKTFFRLKPTYYYSR